MTVQNETEEPVVAEIDDLDFTRRRQRRQSLTGRELGATKVFHADCPCCGLRFAVDMSEAERSMLDKGNKTLYRRVADLVQEYFTEAWKWKTLNRDMNDMFGGKGRGKGPNKSKAIQTDSVKVFVTGVGRSLALVKARVKNVRHVRTDRPWFAVLMDDEASMGDNFIAIPFRHFFAVLQGVADDSPEFRYRLRLAADNALGRDGSGAARDDRGDGEVPAHRGEDGVERWDVPGTVEV
jgi:hypothetical protein